jgi:hypothetical protein
MSATFLCPRLAPPYLLLCIERLMQFSSACNLRHPCLCVAHDLPDFIDKSAGMNLELSVFLLLLAKVCPGPNIPIT